MIKALSEPKQKPETKTKLETKPKPETKLEIKVNKKKLKKLRKYFDELRRKFSKLEIDEYREAFYIAKNYTHLSESEIEKTNKSLNKLKKCLRFKKFHGNIDSVDYEDLDNYDYNYDFANDDEYRKIGSIRALFKDFDRDYYKQIRTDGGFAGRNNNYIEYTGKGDRYENVSPKEYLHMVRPYLRDLINEHKSTMESNDKDNNIDRAEWKIQLTIQNSCISIKSFEETRTIYSKSEALDVFMGIDAEDVIYKLFNTLF